MYPNATEEFYGYATFNLTRRTGRGMPAGEAVGHLGATYGYQSIVAHFPVYNFTLAIATNIETDHQAQPAAALCYAFNGVAALLGGPSAAGCTFVDGGYYSGGCTCK